MIRKKQKSKKPQTRLHLNALDWLFIVTALGTTVYAVFNFHDYSLPYLVADLVALLTGVLYMILGAKGYRSNFIFSTFCVLAATYIAWSNQFYGSMAINILYYLPCEFIGFYLWGRNSRKNHKVVARKLETRQLALIIAGIAIVTALLKFILDACGGAATLLDSVATVTAIVANVLVLLRYREQWLFWLVADFAQLLMWTTVDDPVMLVMRILYPISAIYGYINWRKLVKAPRGAKKRK